MAEPEVRLPQRSRHHRKTGLAKPVLELLGAGVLGHDPGSGNGRCRGSRGQNFLFALGGLPFLLERA